MKVKRYKHAKKVLSFYKNTFKIREPYQIIGECPLIYYISVSLSNLQLTVPSARLHSKARFRSRSSCPSISEVAYS